MIPSIDVLCYLKDLSGLPSDKYLIDLHTKYIKEYGEIHPLATQRVRVFFGYAEVTCPNVNLHVPDVSCGEYPILTVQDGLLVFTFDQYLYDLLSIRNYTMSVNINSSTFEVLGVISDKTYTVPDYDVVSDGSVITVVLSINIGSKVCTFTYNHTTDKPIPEVLETLPPEFTYTPEYGDGNSQLYRVTTTVVSNITTNTSDITIGEYYLPQDEFIIGVEYTTFEAILSEEPYMSNGVTIYTNLLPNIDSVDDIEFSISNVETRQLDYSISSTDHFNYQDMFGNKPIIAAIEPIVLSELYAGTIPMGPVRSIYIVNQYNGNEVYMVAEDGNLGKISDNIYTNHIEYYPLQVGVTYNTPIIGKYDGVIIFNSSTGSSLFDGSYRTDPEDDTILENDSEWYKVNYSNKRVVERSIF